MNQCSIDFWKNIRATAETALKEGLVSSDTCKEESHHDNFVMLSELVRGESHRIQAAHIAAELGFWMKRKTTPDAENEKKEPPRNNIKPLSAEDAIKISGIVLPIIRQELFLNNNDGDYDYAVLQILKTAVTSLGI